MNISELHRDHSFRKSEFPSVEDQIFLAHAAVCPLPSKCSKLIAEYAHACTKGDQENYFPKTRLSEIRQLAADILNCTTDEIALVGPTSVGLSLVANGIDWEKGDNVVFYADDYPSNVVPWKALKEKGVELREISTQNLGEIGIEELKPLVDRKTKLVSLASAHFVSGFRLDLDEIGEWIHQQGSLFCVDGIQTVGALSTSVRNVDFLAADAHKWMLGPCSAGILYVRKEVQEKLRPTLIGWNNVLNRNYITPEHFEWMPHARRYEAGSHNLLGMIGLYAALTILQEYGHKEIEKTILGYTSYLRDKLRKKGFILAGVSDQAISGITSFTHPSKDMPKIHLMLEEKKIMTSPRQTRDGKRWIRFSPHFYNTKNEIDTVLNEL
jgi:cysteine desulfurase/selenocysteine lyase